MNNTQAFNWVSSGLTNVGKVRKINEDNILMLPNRGLWVVADGMGGHEAGDLASQTIVDYLQSIPEAPSFSGFVDEVENRIHLANNNLFAEAYSRGGNVTIGSTVVALVVYNQHVALIWAGDSRIYRAQDSEYKRVTRDHSYVEDLVEQGVIKAEDAESHPQANVITRAVGSAPDLFLDCAILAVQPGDQFLLCSDGLYKHVLDFEMHEAIKEYGASGAAKVLMDLALSRGATDNVTVAVVAALEK